MRPTGISAELLYTLQDARAIADAWREMAVRSGSPFNTPEWFEQTLRIDPGTRPAVVHVHDGERTVGVLPLVEARVAGAPVLRFPGDHLGDTFTLMTAQDVPANAVAVAVGYALATAPRPWRAILLFGAEEGAPWAEALAAAADCHVADRGDIERPGIPGARDGWDGVLAGMKRTNRKETRRIMRRNEEQPGCAFTLVDDPQKVRAAMDTMFTLHDMRWDGMGGSSLKDMQARDLLTGFCVDCAHRGWLRLWVQHIEGRPVAAELAWRLGDRQTHYQGGFDPEWSRLGVGITIFAHAMRAGLDDGVTDIDLGRGTSDYKLRFATRVRRSRRLILTRRGRPEGLAVAGMVWARTLALRLPTDGPGVRGRVRGVVRAARRRHGTAAERGEDGGGDV